MSAIPRERILKRTVLLAGLPDYSTWRVSAGWLYMNRVGDATATFATIGDRLAADDDTDIDLFDNDDLFDATDADDPLNDLDDANDGGFLPGSIGQRLFGGDDFDLGWHSGLEVRVARLPDEHVINANEDLTGPYRLPWFLSGGLYGGFEFRYFQVNGWEQAHAFDIDDDDLLGGTSPIQVGRDGRVVVRQDSVLLNGEANLLSPTSKPGLYLVYGFRYLRLEEDFDAVFTDVSQTDAASIGLRVDNDLYGFQIGVIHDAYYGPLSLSGFGKVGLFGVDSDAGFSLDSDIDYSKQKDGIGIGMVAELGLTARCLVTRSLSIESGYRVMLVSGVALASDQLDGANLATGDFRPNDDGDAFYHGATLNVTYRY
ncbi:MAG: hypothetical protein AAF663_02890 [Planctomycetota bacterium]